MAFVTGYRNDVFISYAHADNEPLSGAQKGWVTTFAHNLNILLSRLLPTDASIWMDHRELKSNVPLTQSIMDALGQTATFVVVVSTRYLSSEWCRREREGFLRLMRARTGAGFRIFAVEMDDLKNETLPGELKDLLFRPFWVKEWDSPVARTLGLPVPNPQEQDYYTRLSRLSYELADELKRLNASADAPPHDLAPACVASHTDKATIYLAEVTDDLDDRREEVKDYLHQAGHSVLPESWRQYEDLAAFEQAMDGDLARSKLFVQLLSQVPGRKPFGQPSRYPRLQYERAVQAGKTILQWRHEKLNVDEVTDAGHLALLETQTVRAEGIEEFKRAIVEAAKPPAPEVVRTSAGKLVFVSTDPTDRTRAEDVVRQALEKRKLSYAMLPRKGDPEVARKFMELSLTNCDAAIVVYCATDLASVFGQVLQCRKVIVQRDGPPPAIAVYDGPPPPDDKDEVSFTFPNLRFLNCRASQTALDEFLDSL